MLAMPTLSVIVPIRDEAAGVATPLAEWWRMQQDAEMLVVDETGSPASDVLRAAGARVLEHGGSRGARLARGAGLARGDVFLFVHGDCRPPDDALAQARKSLGAGAVAGAFSLAYADADRTMRWIAWSANMRSRFLRLPFGDQGLFCTREAYAAAGGFRDLPICDDLDLVRRLKRVGRFAVLPERMLASARRYRRQGAARQTALVWKVLAGYCLGVDPARLARWYRGR